VVWADLHNWDFLIIALVLSIFGDTCLILSDFSITTSWDFRWLKSHEFRLLHVHVTETTILVTKGLVFSIWVPVVMSLIVPVVFVERIIKVTIQPWKLRNMTKVESHLSIFSGLVVVVGSQRVEPFHEVGVHDGVTKVVVWFSLVPEVLWGIWMIEVLQRHFIKYLLLIQ